MAEEQEQSKKGTTDEMMNKKEQVNTDSTTDALSNNERRNAGFLTRFFTQRDTDEDSDFPSAIKKGKVSDVRKHAIMFLRDQQEKERGEWKNEIQFVLATSGLAIGLGNVWRYPWLVYEFGGGSFVFAYMVVLLTIAYPMLLFELAIGQFSSRGPIHIWRSIVPAFEGIGYVLIFFNSISYIYYNALFAVTIFYVGSSYSSPWRHCNSSWNSEYCFDINSYKNCVGNAPNLWYVKTKCYNPGNITLLINKFQDCWANGAEVYGDAVNSSHWQCNFMFQFDFKRSINPCSLVNQVADRNGGRKLSNKDCKTMYSLFTSVSECTYQSQLVLKPDQLTEKLMIARLDFRFRKGDGDLAKMRTAAKFMTNILIRSNSSLFDIFLTYCDKVHSDVTPMACYKGVIDPDESYSSEEYYTYHVDKPGGVGQFSVGICVSWFAAWIIVAVCMHNSINTIGKLSYFTVPLPFVMILVLDVIAFTLPGFETGIGFYVATNWCQLKNPLLWLEALSQAFFSLSLGLGSTTNMASYNEFQTDIVRDSVIICLLDFLISFLGGFGIFGVIGFMAYQVQSTVPLVLRGSSAGLAFVVFAQSTCTLPGGQFLALFFYLTLCLLALSSEIAGLETVMTAVYDEFPVTRHRRWAVVLPIIAFFSVIGFPLTSRSSMTIVKFMDLGLYNILIPVTTLVSMIVVVHIYGIKNLIADIKMTSGVAVGKTTRNWTYYLTCTKLKYYLYIPWAVIVPLAMSAYIISGIYLMTASFESASYLAVSIPALILFILGTFVSIFYRQNRGWALFRPGSVWGPRRNANRWGDQYELVTEDTGLTEDRRNNLNMIIQTTQHSATLPAEDCTFDEVDDLLEQNKGVKDGRQKGSETKKGEDVDNPSTEKTAKSSSVLKFDVGRMVEGRDGGTENENRDESNLQNPNFIHDTDSKGGTNDKTKANDKTKK